MKLTNIRCELTGKSRPRRELQLLVEYLSENLTLYSIEHSIFWSKQHDYIKFNYVDSNEVKPIVESLLKPLKLSYKVGA